MNKVIIAVILAGFGAQLLKIIILWFKHKRLSLHDIVVTGGMPSSHAAFVIGLATILYFTEGTSSAFAVSLVLAFIVIRDSFGVRRSVGNEGKVIQKLLKLHKIDSKFHYALGHTPIQVLAGSIMGFIISLLVHIYL